MKHIYSLLLALFITLSVQAQNCYWTSTTTNGNVVVFLPSPGFPGNQFYANWDFGNGATLQTPVSPLTYIYPNPGVYNVCLSIYDSLNANVVCTYCDSVLISFCSASFLQDSLNPAQFTFFANLQNPNSVANWDFGDGTSGTGLNVNHTYAAQGTYTVTMTEVDFFNNVLCSYTLTVIYSNSSNCSFVYTQPSPVQNPNVFSFSGASNSPGAVFTWDFGDGSPTVTGYNPQHAYGAPGTYTVCMIAISGVDTCNYCQQVTVPGSGQNCTFVAFPDSVNNSTWNFMGVPALLTTVLNWDFGDNTTAVGNNVSHQYAAPGVYNVCMYEVEVATGNIVCTYCMPVNVVNGGTPNCNFTISPVPGNPNAFVFSVPAASNTSYFWDFGNGDTASGNIVTYIYPANGTYNVCLSAGAGGLIVCTSCQTLVVPGTNPGCMANFTSVSVGLIAYFIDQSSVNPPNVPPLPTPVNYSWSFGDGNSSTLQFPQHQYSAPGTYLVCLTVSAVGCTSTYCDSVVIDTTTINPAGCNAYFLFTQTTPYQVIGVNLSSGVNLNFSWDFGDGSPLVSGAYPSHQYTSTGTYAVCLTVSDFLGCSDTYCDTLSVDSLGNIIYRGLTANAGFNINIISPAQLTTGLGEVKQKNIVNLYPVPAGEQLLIDWNPESAGAFNYRVLSADAREVMKGVLTRNANQLSTAQLSPGIYLLTIMAEDGSTESRTFIRQ